jgi:hypothetical protein
LTEQERVERAAAKAAERERNRAAWRADPSNGNNRHTREQEKLKAARLEATPISDNERSSASLQRLKWIMADPGTPLYRRLDCAELVLSYELGPGAVAGLDPDEVGADSYRFLRAVSENDDTPEPLKFRSLKAIVAVENARAAIRNASEALVAKKHLLIALVNGERKRAMHINNAWPPPKGSCWWVNSSDTIPWPRGWPGLWSWPLTAMAPAYGAGDATMLRAELLAIKATNRIDDWDTLLTAPTA